MSTVTSLLTYPRRRDDWYVGLAVGGVCLALAALLVPLVVVYGYLIRVARTIMDGSATPPGFEDPIALLADGVRGWIIGFVYLLVPLLVGGLTVGGAVRALVAGGEIGQVIGFWTLFVGGFVTLVVTIAFGYLGVAAVLAFARTGRFESAFAPGHVLRVTRSRPFARAYVGALALASAGLAVTAVPIVGWLLGPFALWYMTIVAMAVLASAHVDLVDR